MVSGAAAVRRPFEQSVLECRKGTPSSTHGSDAAWYNTSMLISNLHEDCAPAYLPGMCCTLGLASRWRQQAARPSACPRTRAPRLMACCQPDTHLPART